MELLPLGRVLWRRRWSLAIGALLAIVVAFAVGAPQRGTAAVAWTQVTLDTPSSQIIASSPRGADTLPWRASLLSHLLGTDATRQQLADRLKVPLDQVTVADAALAVPLVPASMPQTASEAAAVTVAPYVLTVSLKNSALPLISLEAAGPDGAAATRLAEAAVGVLKEQASDAGTYTSRIPTGDAPTYQPFVVEDVAGIRVRAAAAKEPPIKALAAAAFVFVLWCAATAIVVRRPRRRPRVIRMSRA